MSNNPHPFRSRQELPLQWQAPVALQTPTGEPDPDLAEPGAADHETSRLHATARGSAGPGLVSELLATGIIVIGVTITVCSALYAAGAFTAANPAGKAGEPR